MRVRAGAARDELLTLLWPSSDLSLAAQSLNTLVYTLNRTLREALAGRPPVVHASGRYRLNVDAGLAVDFHEFEAAADAGDLVRARGRPSRRHPFGSNGRRSCITATW